jgi:NAD(P)-dependent dehydrogenase (short-subunit alcohol dehydrogenase family)
MATGILRRLEGKSVLVAGSGGIGSELARRYAQEGALVTLGDVNLDSAHAVVQEIRQAGGEANSVRLDGSDQTSIAEAVTQCQKTYGGLDGLHANFASFADASPDEGVLELSLEAYDETMRVNARGYFLCTRLALPAIIAYRGGRERPAYAMSKAAGGALMRHVASRYGKDGVRANSVAPGLILHKKLETELSEEFKAFFFNTMQIKSRLGRPTDIAGISALLMSEEGSFITGQVISVDGGATMRA